MEGHMGAKEQIIFKNTHKSQETYQKKKGKGNLKA